MVIALIAADGRRQLFLRASTFGVIVLACLALYAPYLAGLFLDTAANFFRGLSVRPATLPEISLIFWPQFPVGRMLIVGGMCGALLCACLGSGRLRLAAVGLIITELLLLAIGALQFVSPFWFGPALWYFEGFLYLHFAVFLFAGPYIAVRAGGRLLTRLIPSAGLRLPMASSSLAWRVAGLGIAAVAAGYVLARGTTGTAGPGFIPAVQAETVITRTLKDEIGLDSDNRFRGRVADFFGRSMPANNNFNIWNYLRFFALRSTGNTHGGPGLWQDAIPTLTEYSPHMTPAYFAFNRRFFTLADDIQTRNWLHMRRIEPRLLALAGVRFVITDTKFEGAANLRAEIPIQVSGSVLKEFYAPGEFRKHAFSLHLYEIPNTNTGDYSPTVVRQATDAAEALGLLGAADFDPRHEVVTHEKIAHELMPATLQEFSVERGRFRVRATSPARSLLLLPIEFSRCLRISNEGPATGNESVRLVRADLLLTGLLFEKVVDIAVGYFNGPFSHPFCRLIDRREYQALSISDAFRHQPEFLPK